MPISTATIAQQASEVYKVAQQAHISSVPLEIIKLILSGITSFLFSFAAIFIGIFKSLSIRKDDINTISGTFKLIFIPLLYIAFSYTLFSIIAVSFRFFYNADISLKIQHFFEFTQIHTNSHKNYSNLNLIIRNLRDFILYLTALTYLAIPLFYFSYFFKTLEFWKLPTSTTDNINVWSLLFHSGIAIFIGFIIITIFNNIVSHILFGYPTNIPGLGTITNIHQLTIKLLQNFTKNALSATINPY